MKTRCPRRRRCSHVLEGHPAGLQLLAIGSRLDVFAFDLHLARGVVRGCRIGAVAYVVVIEAITVAEDHALVDELVETYLISDFGRSFLLIDRFFLLVCGVFKGDCSDLWLVTSLPAVVTDRVSVCSISDVEPYFLLSFKTSGVRERFFLIFPTISLDRDLLVEFTQSMTSSKI